MEQIKFKIFSRLAIQRNGTDPFRPFTRTVEDMLLFFYRELNLFFSKGRNTFGKIQKQNKYCRLHFCTRFLPQAKETFMGIENTHFDHYMVSIKNIFKITTIMNAVSC